jgi:hypothetical protein
MGALVFWLGVGLLLALVLLAARAIDRRDRRRGRPAGQGAEPATTLGGRAGRWTGGRAGAGRRGGCVVAGGSLHRSGIRLLGPAGDPAADRPGCPAEAAGPGGGGRDARVVGLVRTAERTWQGASGLGDLRAKRSARVGDRFRVGSVTKSFVATVVLRLVGEGRLSLDDNLERWLPGLVSGGERVRVRQLLSTSPRWTPPGRGRPARWCPPLSRPARTRSRRSARSLCLTCVPRAPARSASRPPSISLANSTQGRTTPAPSSMASGSVTPALCGLPAFSLRSVPVLSRSLSRWRQRPCRARTADPGTGAGRRPRQSGPQHPLVRAGSAWQREPRDPGGRERSRRVC